MGEEKFLSLGSPLTGREVGQDGGELQSLRGECSSWWAAVGAGGDLHEWSVPTPCCPQLEACIHWCGLGAGTWASEIQPRERTGDGQPRLAGIRLQPQLRVCVQKSQLP